MVPETHPYVRGHRPVVQEELLDDPAFVTEAQDKLVNPCGGKALHDVPYDRAIADRKHRLRNGFTGVPNSGALASAKDDCFHGFIFLLEQAGTVISKVIAT